MANNFMTKKEFDRMVFSQRHKKDYGPKYLRILGCMGGIYLFFWLLFILLASQDEKRAMKDVFRSDFADNPIGILIQLALIGCFIASVLFSGKRYIDLDSEYKAYMSQVTINQVQGRRAKFCDSCGTPISDKAWQDGYCSQCGIKIRKM